MERVRADLHKEHGGGTFHQVMFNLAEYQARKGGDGFRWDGEAWFGGDVNRLVLKSEGEGAFNGGVDSAEIQALYSRAINPYWNVQARSEEHTSELQSLMRISYAVFCLKKKKNQLH